MKVQYIGQVLRIDAQEWYRRRDFRDFLNGKRPVQQGCQPATWHQRRRKIPDDFADVFVTYDHGEGSDAAPAIPEDIWQEICVTAEENSFTEGLVWIANLEP